MQPTRSTRPRVAALLAAVATLLLVAAGTAACGQSAAPPAVPGNVQFLPGDGLAGGGVGRAGGTAPVTGYKVTASPGGHSCTTTGAHRCLVHGLTNGSVYHLALRSVGPGGTSPAVTGTVTAGAPWPPGELAGSVGDSTVTVGWFAPLSPAAPITSYTVTADPGIRHVHVHVHLVHRERPDQRHLLHLHGHGDEQVRHQCEVRAQRLLHPVVTGRRLGRHRLPGTGQRQPGDLHGHDPPA